MKAGCDFAEKNVTHWQRCSSDFLNKGWLLAACSCDGCNYRHYPSRCVPFAFCSLTARVMTGPEGMDTRPACCFPVCPGCRLEHPVTEFSLPQPSTQFTNIWQTAEGERPEQLYIKRKVSILTGRIGSGCIGSCLSSQSNRRTGQKNHEFAASLDCTESFRFTWATRGDLILKMIIITIIVITWRPDFAVFKTCNPWSYIQPGGFSVLLMSVCWFLLIEKLQEKKGPLLPFTLPLPFS